MGGFPNFTNAKPRNTPKAADKSREKRSEDLVCCGPCLVGDAAGTKSLCAPPLSRPLLSLVAVIGHTLSGWRELGSSSQFQFEQADFNGKRLLNVRSQPTLQLLNHLQIGERLTRIEPISHCPAAGFGRKR